MKISTLLIVPLILMAQNALSQSHDNLSGDWALQVENLQHEVITTANVNFTKKTAESCIGGNWKQVTVKSKWSSDKDFFPIEENLSYELNDGVLTIGRNEICDAYLHLRSSLKANAASGEYIQFGWGQSTLGYFLLRRNESQPSLTSHSKSEARP